MHNEKKEQPQELTTNNNAANEQHQPCEDPQLELAREHRMAEEASARRAELELQNQKLEAETLKLKYEQNLKSELQKVRVRFYNVQAVFKLLDESVEIGPGLNGEVRVEVNGKPASLNEVLEDFALKNRWLVEDLGELKFDDTKLTKADLRTLEEKSAFISRKGADAWERLPRTREEVIDTSRMTGEQYRRLSGNRKSELIASLGVSGVEEILKRRG